MEQHKIVTHDEWLAARRELLRKEKELTRQHDQVAKQRLDMPWEKVEKKYVFDGPDGEETLAGLFGKRSQLVVYHFMFGPGWKEGCPSCSLLSDHLDGALVHLEARDISLVVISRAPLAEIEAFKKRMGWKFKWVSSNGTDFNFDYHVSFTDDEIAKGAMEYNFKTQKFPSSEGPGASVFFKHAKGEVYHTYSSYARGLENVIGAYQLLDIAPKGRDEADLEFTMSWVRHHDRYVDQSVVQLTAR